MTEQLALFIADLSSMGDPWESGQFGLHSFAGAQEPDFDERRTTVRRVSSALRGQTRIVSLTRDRPTGEPGSAEWSLTRGYSRPRMWEVYGENHEGFCLLVDRRRISDNFQQMFGEPEVFTFCANVEYPTDLRAHFAGLSLSVANVSVSDIERLVADTMRTRHEVLFLTKNRDWSGEDEFRLGLIGATSEAPRLLPLTDAAVAIVIGARATQSTVGALGSLARALALETSVAQLSWINGIPELVPCAWSATGELRSMTDHELRGVVEYDDGLSV